MSGNPGPSSHAQAKGTTQAVAVVRASTGLTTHRPAGARVRARCHGSRDPPAGRDREPVCEPHDSTGEPGAGNRHAGFGERGEETYPWESACGPERKRRKSHRPPTGYALPLDSTRMVSVPSSAPGRRADPTGTDQSGSEGTQGGGGDCGIKTPEHTPHAAPSTPLLPPEPLVA